MREIGREHFYIELIEKYECNDVEELRKKEGEWIRNIGTLNGLVAGRTSQEHYYENREVRLEQQKEYYQNNIEHKKEYDKEYHKLNKEKRQEQAKVRYEDKKEYIKQKSNENYYKNKEKYRARDNAKVQCECGVIHSKGNTARHLKSQHHQNFLNNNIANVSQQESQQTETSTSS